MKNSKVIEDIAFNISEDLAGEPEYQEVTSKIANLQRELKKELSEEGIKIFMEISNLEAESETFAIDYSCKKAFFQGIEIGQAVEQSKSGRGKK